MLIKLILKLDLYNHDTKESNPKYVFAVTARDISVCNFFQGMNVGFKTSTVILAGDHNNALLIFLWFAK